MTASSPTAQPTVLTTSAPTFDCSPNLVFASGICPIASRSAALVDSLTCSTVCAPVFRTWWSRCSSLFKNDQSLLGPLTKYNEKCKSNRPSVHQSKPSLPFSLLPAKHTRHPLCQLAETAPVN